MNNDMFYTVYHDTWVVSKKYFCESYTITAGSVVLNNVCGDVIAKQLVLNTSRGDVRINENSVKAA